MVYQLKKQGEEGRSDADDGGSDLDGGVMIAVMRWDASRLDTVSAFMEVL